MVTVMLLKADQRPQPSPRTAMQTWRDPLGRQGLPISTSLIIFAEERSGRSMGQWEEDLSSVFALRPARCHSMTALCPGLNGFVGERKYKHKTGEWHKFSKASHAWSWIIEGWAWKWGRGTKQVPISGKKGPVRRSWEQVEDGIVN